MDKTEDELLEKLVGILYTSGISSIPTKSFLRARIKSRQANIPSTIQGTFTSDIDYASPVCYAEEKEVQPEYLNEDQLMMLIDEWIDQLILMHRQKFLTSK